MPDLNPKPPSASAVKMTEIVLPSHTNALGTIFGGQVMGWIDIAAAIAAGRHARRVVVTASVDNLNFEAPVKLGQYIHVYAQVNYARRTSMEVGVRVQSEDPLTGDLHENVSTYLTFVALDSQGRPTPVPQIQPQTDVEKRRYAEAEKRHLARQKLAEEIKKSRHP